MNLYENLTDEDLDNLRVEVLIEQERRQARDQIPAQIAALATRFIDAGGDPNELHVDVARRPHQQGAHDAHPEG